MVNLKHLYYFFNFSKDWSTANAAKRLGITSPALSNQLKQLEQSVGVSLSRRVNGRLVLTECGQIVLHYAERMFSVYEDLNTRLSSIHDTAKDQLRVGVSHNLGARFALDLLSLLERSDVARPKRLQLFFDSSETVLAMFTLGQFDVILGDFDPKIQTHEGWTSHRVCFPVRLFVSRSLLKNTAAGGKLVTIKDPNQIIELANANKVALVLSTLSVLRDETDRFLASLSVRPQRTIECNCPGAIVHDVGPINWSI